MKPVKHNHFIREAIKTLMKEKKLRYSVLARALGVSLPTVKRMMTQDSLTLSRLTEICDWLGIEFYDLMTLAKSLQEKEIRYLTTEQEMFLVRSPQTCRFLIEIMNFLTPAQIAQKFRLNQKSVESYMADLQKVGLIRGKTSTAVQVAPELLRGPRPQGPLKLDLNKRYRKFIPTLVAREIDQQTKDMTQPTADSPREKIAICGFNLTSDARNELQKSLKQIREKFAEIERVQAQTAEPSRLQPVTFVTLLTEGSVYAEAYGEIRNRS